MFCCQQRVTKKKTRHGSETVHNDDVVRAVVSIYIYIVVAKFVIISIGRVPTEAFK